MYKFLNLYISLWVHRDFIPYIGIHYPFGNEIFIGFIIHRLRGGRERIFLYYGIAYHVNCGWDFTLLYIQHSKFGLRSDKGVLLHKHSRHTLNYFPIYFFLLTIQWIDIG